jgi:hypothetical protein
MSNETIHGIVRRVKRRSSPFLTETQVKLRLGTVVGLGVKHPEVDASRWAWRSIGNPNIFLRSSFFSRPPPELPVLRKKPILPSSLIWGKRNRLPVGKLDIRVVA